MSREHVNRPGIGVVGWGAIAHRHRASLEAAGARFVGAVTRRPSSDGAVRRFKSLDALLPHADGVTIAVPNALHAELAAKVIRAGKPVLVEKPLVTRRCQLDAVAPILAAARAPVYVGFRLRWNPRLRQLRRRIDRPRRIRCRFGLGIDLLADGKPWTREAAATGGAFFTLGCHMLDLARWLANAPNERLVDMRARVSGSEPGCDYPLHATVEGRLGERTEVVATADTRSGTPYRIEVSVEHDVEHDGEPQERITLGVEDEPVEYTAMFADFVSNVISANRQPMGIEDMLNLHRDLLAARTVAGRN